MLGKRKLPILTSIADLERGRPDTADIIDIGECYEYGIDTSHGESTSRAGHWHPSSVGYCKRAVVYQYLRTPPTDRRPKTFKEIVMLGHSIHDIVQNGLERMRPVLAQFGIKCEFAAEVPHDPETDKLRLELDIGGTCDGLIRFWTKDWEQLGTVEIKSSNKEWWEKVRMQAGANPKHLMQSHIYANRFDTPIIWVWYYNKDNSKREIKTHLYDPLIFEEACNYFLTCDSFVRAGTLPEREESYFECSGCEFRTLCNPVALRGKKKSHMSPPIKGFARKAKS